MMFGQLGKWLLVAAGVLAVVGVAMVLLSRAGVERLPGDIDLRGRNWRVIVPLGTCVAASILLTLLLWLLNRLRGG